MTFRRKQRVVCINAKGGWRNLLGEEVDTGELVEGAIYTIRWVGRHNRRASVRLEEMIRGFTVPPNVRKTENMGEDVPWAASRFRPLVATETKTSFTTGADPSTDQFDNRRRVKVGVSA